MLFRDWLREARLNAGKSQVQLADELGISFATLNRYENGCPVSITNLKLIADYFEVNVAELRKMEVR